MHRCIHTYTGNRSRISTRLFATPLSPYSLPDCILGTSVSQTPRLPYCIHLYTGASLSQTHVCRHCFKGLTLLQGLLRFFCKVKIMLVPLVALRVHSHSQSAQALEHCHCIGSLRCIQQLYLLQLAMLMVRWCIIFRARGNEGNGVAWSLSSQGVQLEVLQVAKCAIPSDTVGTMFTRVIWVCHAT